MPAEIRIDDLASPRYSAQQRSILEFGETLDVSLDAREILDEAATALSLRDYGAPDFMPRLELLCEEWGGDEGLNNLGRLSLRNKLLQYAKNRLLIHDTLKRHPEIHEVEIARPIIVAGLPRSGTTHLLNLMAADRRLRSLPLWESFEPVPLPKEVPDGHSADPRYVRCDEAWQMMLQTVPHLAAMHPMNPDHIHEELELMGPDFASYNFEWLSPSPRWRDYYYANDQQPHYDYMKTVLRILTWQDGDRDGSQTRWVLKCPQHLEQLPVLDRVFPDATVVITHRDPVSVIQSAATMLCYGQRMSRHRIDPPATARYWADRVHHLLQACVRDRELLDESRSIDVLFHEFMADDIAMAKKIYARAGLDMNGTAEEALRSFAQSNRRGGQGRVVYDLEGDFGLSASELRKRFDFYFQRFAVEAEGG